jgi:putative endonuclease
MFVFVYVLLSKKDGKFYIGKTRNLKVRFEEHCKGRVEATSARRPFELAYYESCKNGSDANHREMYLKTTHGRHFLRRRLKSYLTGVKIY